MHLPGSIRLANAPSCSRRLQNAITSRRFSSLHRKRAIALPNSKYPTQRCPYPKAGERIQQRNKTCRLFAIANFKHSRSHQPVASLICAERIQSLCRPIANAASPLSESRRENPTGGERSVLLPRSAAVQHATVVPIRKGFLQPVHSGFF
jgi:hypothetical protein